MRHTTPLQSYQNHEFDRLERHKKCRVSGGNNRFSNVTICGQFRREQSVLVDVTQSVDI